MNNQFNPFELLNSLADSGENGQLMIKENSVIWKLYFFEGKLQYGSHSLQSINTIKHYLTSLGYGNVAKNSPLMSKKISSNNQLILFDKLVSQGYINSEQKIKLIKELTKDTIESLLCLTKGEVNWVSKTKKVNIFSGSEEALIEIPILVDNLCQKLREWQKLNQFITSPHQRPYCINSSLDKQSSSGTLSIKVFQQLVKLMRGVSISQLAVFLKQDDLKLAQILSPYIKNKILKLYPPKAPLDKLPSIPAKFVFDQKLQAENDNQKSPVSSNHKATPPQTTNQKHKIVCIDDSTTMLDMIQDFLGTEKYELFTLDNPMESLSFLFKSKPHLILMDISMPGINGNRLCQILKNSPVFKKTPIILISGNTKILNQETLKTTGATDFLPKPFDKEALLTMVEGQLQSVNSKV